MPETVKVNGVDAEYWKAGEPYEPSGGSMTVSGKEMSSRVEIGYNREGLLFRQFALFRLWMSLVTLEWTFATMDLKTSNITFLP